MPHEFAALESTVKAGLRQGGRGVEKGPALT
jgi:hypothetical protein